MTLEVDSIHRVQSVVALDQPVAQAVLERPSSDRRMFSAPIEEKISVAPVYEDCVAALARPLRENKIIGDAFVAIAESFTGTTQRKVADVHPVDAAPSPRQKEEIYHLSPATPRAASPRTPSPEFVTERPEVVTTERPVTVVTARPEVVAETVVQPVDAAASPRLKEVSTVIERRDEAVASTSVRPEVVVTERSEVVVTPRSEVVVEKVVQPVDAVARPVDVVVQSVDAVAQPVDAAASPRQKEVSTVIDRRDEAVASTSVRPAVIVTERPEVVVTERPEAVVTPRPAVVIETVAQPVDAAASPRQKEEIYHLSPATPRAASPRMPSPEFVTERPEVVTTERPAVVVTERPVAVVTPRPAVVVETVARPVETVVQSVDAAVQPVDAAASPRLREVSTIIDRRDEAVASTSVRPAEDEAADEAAAAQQVVVEAPVRAESVQLVETAAPAASVQAVSSAHVVSPTEMVLVAAEAVADALTVTLGERVGEGEVVVRLRPDVLDGSVIKVDVSGADVAVSFTPATPAAAQVLTEHVGELKTHLQHTVPAYNCEIAIADVTLVAVQAESVAVNQAGAVAARMAARSEAVVGNSNRKRT